MSYIVEVISLDKSIGAKQKKAIFTHKEDAKAQYETWKKWLDAETDYDECDMLHTWQATSRELSYSVKMYESLPHVTKIEDIDFDSHN